MEIPKGTLTLPEAFDRFIELKYRNQEDGPYGVLRYHCHADGLAFGVGPNVLERRKAAFDAAWALEWDDFAQAFASGELEASYIKDSREVRLIWHQIGFPHMLFIDGNETIPAHYASGANHLIGVTPFIAPQDVQEWVAKIRLWEFKDGVPRKQRRLLTAILLDLVEHPSAGVEHDLAKSRSVDMASRWGLPSLEAGIIKPLSQLSEGNIFPAHGNALTLLSELNYMPSAFRRKTPPTDNIDQLATFMPFASAALAIYAGRNSGAVEITDAAMADAPANLAMLLNNEKLTAEGKRNGLFEPMHGCWHGADVRTGHWLGADEGDTLTVGSGDDRLTWTNIRLRTADILMLSASSTIPQAEAPGCFSGEMPALLAAMIDTTRGSKTRAILSAAWERWRGTVPVYESVERRNDALFDTMKNLNPDYSEASRPDRGTFSNAVEQYEEAISRDFPRHSA